MLALSYLDIINRLSIKAHQYINLHNEDIYDQMISVQGKGTKIKTRDPAFPYICLQTFFMEIGFPAIQIFFE